MNKKVYRRETLYSKNANNQVLEWNIDIREIGNKCEVSMYSGLFGRSRLNKPDVFIITEGKNIGKSNETTVLEQAIKESKAKWVYKIERDGYISLIKNGFTKDQLINLTEEQVFKALPDVKSYQGGHGLPMLAKSLADINPSKIKFPMLAQAKLNGIRCDGALEEGKINLFSKKGMSYNKTMAHIVKELELLYQNINVDFILDGELYKHGWILSRIGSAVKKFNAESNQLIFVIFDLKLLNTKQQDRLDILKGIQVIIDTLELKHIKVLGYEMCNDYEQMLHLTKVFVELGFEGGIFRNPNAFYGFDKRNLDMIKSKLYKDGEFKLIDIVPYPKNTKLGTLVFQNDITDGTFKSEWEGSHAEKAEMLKNKHKYIGKMFTVKYYERTVNNLPFHTKTIAIRDYE